MSNVINVFLAAQATLATEQAKLDATRTPAVREWEGLEYQLQQQPADWPRRGAAVLRVCAIETAHAAELKTFWEVLTESSREGGAYHRASEDLHVADEALRGAMILNPDVRRKAREAGITMNEWGEIVVAE